jgi:hypothetical protein
VIDSLQVPAGKPAKMVREIFPFLDFGFIHKLFTAEIAENAEQKTISYKLILAQILLHHQLVLKQPPSPSSSPPFLPEVVKKFPKSPPPSPSAIQGEDILFSFQ